MATGAMMISNLNLIYIVSIVHGAAVHMITTGSLSLPGHLPLTTLAHPLGRGIECPSKMYEQA